MSALDATLFCELKEGDHAQPGSVSCTVRYFLNDLAKRVLIHPELVVFHFLEVTRSSGFICFNHILDGVDFEHGIVCDESRCHFLNDNKAVEHLGVLDRLNVAVVDLREGHLLIVLSEVLLHKAIDELLTCHVCFFLY